MASFIRSASSSIRLARSPAFPRPTAYQARLLSRSIPRLQPLTPEARQKIQDAVTAHPLVVFMKGTPDMPQCGFSRAVCQVLEVQGVRKDRMKTYNILEDQELREGIKEYSEWPTIPQLYVNGEFYGGCDIVLSMHQSGELEALLEKADVLLPLPPADGQEAQAATTGKSA